MTRQVTFFFSFFFGSIGLSFSKKLLYQWTDSLFWCFIIVCGCIPCEQNIIDQENPEIVSFISQNLNRDYENMTSWRYILYYLRRHISIATTTILFGFFIVQSFYHIQAYNSIGVYFHIITVIVFHSSEYLFSAIYHPNLCSWGSFLLNNGYIYTACISLSVFERLLWSHVIYDYHFNYYHMHYNSFFSLFCQFIGGICSVFGIILRILSFIYAKNNFTHTISTHKRSTHKLIMTGPYSICRHPSYLGWFLWSLGSQLILLNPFCFLLFFILELHFFKRRIAIEEYYLHKHFGNEYNLYSYRTPVWIPFVQIYLDHIKYKRYASEAIKIKYPKN